jgi:hypothetical protein
MSSVRFCNSFFIDLTSLFYFVLLGVALFETFCDGSGSTGLGMPTLETEGAERVSPLLLLPFGGVSFVVSAELWDCDVDEALVGTADLEEEKK